MPNCLQFALSNPVQGKEVAFNDWYGGHHLQTGVTTPGILAGQRFKRTPGPWPQGSHEYLALWELDDPPYALDQLARVKGTDKMPLSDAIDMAGIQPPTMWVRATIKSCARVVTDSSTRGPIVFMLANPLPGEARAFLDSLLHSALVRIADTPGVVSVDLLTLADEQIRNNARKFSTGILIEMNNEEIAIGGLDQILPNLDQLDGERWKAPVFRPLDRRLTTLEASH